MTRLPMLKMKILLIRILLSVQSKIIKNIPEASIKKLQLLSNDAVFRSLKRILLFLKSSIVSLLVCERIKDFGWIREIVSQCLALEFCVGSDKQNLLY